MEKNNASNFSGMAANPQECWEVYQKVLEETKTLEDYLDEECSPRSFDGKEPFSNIFLPNYIWEKITKIILSEGEEEADWLRAAGLSELTEPWKEGREIQPEELGAALRPLSRAQAEAVKRRVRSLNHTVKQRYNQRQRVRKPDIRDVFKDSEVC